MAARLKTEKNLFGTFWVLKLFHSYNSVEIWSLESAFGRKMATIKTRKNNLKISCEMFRN